MRGVGPFPPTAKDTIVHLHQIIHLASVRHWRIEMLGLRKTSWDKQKPHWAMLFLFMGIQCPYTLLITCKPVVHTRLCMAFNFLKQLPKNILLSKSSDISKSSMPKSGHTRHIPA